MTAGIGVRMVRKVVPVGFLLHCLQVRLRLALSRLTTLWQAAGDDKGLKVKVIEEQDEVGKGKGEDAEGE